MYVVCDCVLQWWVYIVGNLVGVSVAEIDGPMGGHKFAEVVDLLVSVWSLTIAGLVIGLVGSLAWVNVLTESADDRLTQHFSKAFQVGSAVRALAANGSGGLTFDDFLKLCREKSINTSEKSLRTVFDEADVDGSGSIDSEEVDKLLGKLEQLEAPGGEAQDGVPELTARLNEMDAKLDRLLAALSSSRA